MDLPSSWTFALFTLCFVALIAGALLGFASGFVRVADKNAFGW